MNPACISPKFSPELCSRGDRVLSISPTLSMDLKKIKPEKNVHAKESTSIHNFTFGSVSEAGMGWSSWLVTGELASLSALGRVQGSRKKRVSTKQFPGITTTSNSALWGLKSGENSITF